MTRLRNAAALVGAALILALVSPAGAQTHEEPEPEFSVNPYETYRVEVEERNHDGVVTAECEFDPDAGRYDVAIAGGVYTFLDDDFVVQRSFPVGSPPYAWSGSHRSVHSPNDRHKLTVFALCLKVQADPVNPQVPDDYGFDPLGIYVNKSDGFQDDGQAWIRCNGGDRAINGGLDVPLIDGNRYVLKRSFPTAGNQDVPAREGQRPDGWKVTVRSVAIGDPPGEVSVYVICVPLQPTTSTASDTSNPELAASTPKFWMREANVRLAIANEDAWAVCDEGEVVLGGGGHVIEFGERHAVSWTAPVIRRRLGYPDAWGVGTRYVDKGHLPALTEGFAICGPVIS